MKLVEVYVNQKGFKPSKVKVKPKHHYPVAFLKKKRYGKVVNKLSLIKSQINNSSSKRLIRSLLKEYESLAPFDSPSQRLALTKYANFLHITNGQKQDELLGHIISGFELQSLNNGVVQSLKSYKALYGLACRFATGHAFEPIPYLKADHEGFPKILKPLKSLLTGSRSDRQTALGILQVIKLVRYYPKDYDLGAIEKQPLNTTSAFKEGHVEIGTYFSEAFEKVKDKLPPDFTIKKFLISYKITINRMFPNKYLESRKTEINNRSSLHFSGRNGPNGPCLSTVVLDHNALTNDKQLLTNVQRLADLTDNLDLQVLLDNFNDEEYIFSNVKQKETIHSKINLKEEPWGRLRPFATVDYFTHSALKGFHKWLYNYLERLPEDCTKDQDRGADAIRLWTTFFVDTESADLSEATNAIPILVQREIVQQIAGDEYAELWANIISNRTFKGPTGEDVKYLCGQPMGASSSWPMLAMWHHVIMRTCMTYLKIKWGKDHVENYYVIGDDIAMKGQELFHIYEIAVGILQDVGISKSKGFHSETDLPTNYLPGDNHKAVAEFAKRIFYNGSEITPVPPDEVVDYCCTPYTLPSMMHSMQRRDYFIDANVAQDLAELSFDKQLALDCLFAPFSECPTSVGNPQLKHEELKNSTIWHQQELNEAVVCTVYMKVFEQVNKIQLDMGERLTNWVEACLNHDEIKVKSWSYQCVTMSKVFYITMETMQSVYDRSLEDFYSSKHEGSPETWRTFKKTVGNLQVVLEIDNILKDINKPKTDRYRFIANILARAITACRRDSKQKDQ